MSESRRLSYLELAAILERRPGARASLACEGIYLTDEEEALFEQFDRERLPPEERRARLVAYSRDQRRKSGLPAD